MSLIYCRRIWMKGEERRPLAYPYSKKVSFSSSNDSNFLLYMKTDIDRIRSSTRIEIQCCFPSIELSVKASKMASVIIIAKTIILIQK